MKIIFTSIICVFMSLNWMYGQQYQNILTNPGARDSTNGWTINTSGGDGWGYTKTEGVDSTNCWTGSFDWSTKSQLIDMVAIGYSEQLLDEAPIVVFSERYRGRAVGGSFSDEYNLKIELRDGSGNVIQSFDSGTITTTGDWETISGTFKGYGSGLRYIYYEHSSRDIDYWAGHFGAQIDASYLSILNNVTYAGGKTGDLSGWDIIKDGGDGWGIDANGWYITSFDTCKKAQLIDLVALGYSEEELDMVPRIDVGEFMRGTGTDFADIHGIKVELRDGNQNVMESFSQQTTATEDWQWVGSSFDGYDQGLRYIYFEHSGIDAEFWAGHYGVNIDHSYVEIEQVSVWPTAVEDELDGMTMNLYPNPVVDHFAIQLKNANLTDATISLLNLNGQVIQTKTVGNLHNESKVISFSFPQKLTAGVYLVQMKSNEGIRSTRMIVQ